MNNGESTLTAALSFSDCVRATSLPFSLASPDLSAFSDLFSGASVAAPVDSPSSRIAPGSDARGPSSANSWSARKTANEKGSHSKVNKRNESRARLRLYLELQRDAIKLGQRGTARHACVKQSM